MFLYVVLMTVMLAELETQMVNTELPQIVTLLTESPAEESTPETTVHNETPLTVSPAEQKETSIIITNAIEPHMLAYKHWTGTYSPDTFSITINDTEVAQGACYTATTNDPIAVSYNYSFAKGMYTGTKTVSYQLNENTSQAQITFSWNDNRRILVDNGTPIK